MEKNNKTLAALLLGALAMCGCTHEPLGQPEGQLSVVADTAAVVVYPRSLSHETLLGFTVSGMTERTVLSVDGFRNLEASVQADPGTGKGSLFLLAKEDFNEDTTLEIVAEDAGRRAGASVAVSLARIEVSKENLSFPSSGGTEAMGVDANIRFATRSDVAWLSFSSSQDSIHVACMENKMEEKRTATIIIGDGVMEVSLPVVQDAPAVDGLPAGEVEALHAIWDTLHMEDNDDWDFTASLPGARKPWRDKYPVEEWAGVTLLSIGGESHVVYLAVGGHGTIPPEIGDLVFLRELDLSQRCGLLTGQIPESFGQLTRLKHLGIVGTSVSGTIPEELSALKELETLGLENNYLEGNLPLWLADMPSLVNFGFSGNCFDGKIDPSLTKTSWWTSPHGTTGMPLGEYYLSLGQREGHRLWL